MARLVAVCSLAAVAGCGGEPRLGARYFTTRLCRLDAVAVGSAVRYAGVPVGRVDAIHLDSLGYRLTLAVTRSDAPLKANDSLVVGPGGLLAPDPLDVVAGPPGAPRLLDGATLPARPRPSTAEQRREVVRIITTAVAPNIGVYIPRGSLAPDTTCGDQ